MVFLLERTGSWLTFEVSNNLEDDDTLIVQIVVRNWGLKGDFGTVVEMWLDFDPVLLQNCSQITEHWGNHTSVPAYLPVTSGNKTIHVFVPQFAPRATTTLLLSIEAPEHRDLFTVELLQSVPQPGLGNLHSRAARKSTTSRAWLGAVLFAAVMVTLVGIAILVRRYRRDQQPLRHIELSYQPD